MLEIQDELMTPGCPQCAIKHLSAALYHKAKESSDGDESIPPDPYVTAVCVAYINLVEVKAGYRSHLWYAVGALVHAEERLPPWDAGDHVAREARLLLEERGYDAVPDAMKLIDDGIVAGHANWARAHFSEALRELPTYAGGMTMGNIAETIEKIRNDFFTTDQEATAASTEDAGKGGDEDMKKTAIKKAPAKKADPKATKAACKGGKAKKCCK